ncbi:MAG TPA: DUF3090 family protein [Acidimicrobiales bacterium]|nr:DUF3090 family protein [Acidimicrobiales bacterium]
MRYELDHPSRVTVGTVGPVGERLFVLQAREDDRVVTVKVEKVQVASLAAYLGRMLRQLARPHELPSGPELELEGFAEPDFTAEALALSYDELADRVVLVVDEIDRSESEQEPETSGVELDGDVVRLAMTREQAAALAIRATELVEAGRPPCPLCGYPLDPRGHACPRTNGNSAPLT